MQLRSSWNTTDYQRTYRCGDFCAIQLPNNAKGDRSKSVQPINVLAETRYVDRRTDADDTQIVLLPETQMLGRSERPDFIRPPPNTYCCLYDVHVVF